MARKASFDSPTSTRHSAKKLDFQLNVSCLLIPQAAKPPEVYIRRFLHSIHRLLEAPNASRVRPRPFRPRQAPRLASSCRYSCGAVRLLLLKGVFMEAWGNPAGILETSRGFRGETGHQTTGTWGVEIMG